MKQFSSLQESMKEALSENDEKEILEISNIIDKSDIQEKDKKKIFALIEKEEFKGPLPHPSILKRYEEIQPGFANEIMQMATNEQTHRHDMEYMIVKSQTELNAGQLDVIKASIKLKTRLQVFGFASTFFLLLVGAACIFLDKNVGSIVPFILAIGSFCWTMFYGKRKDDEDEEDNEDEEDDDDKN